MRLWGVYDGVGMARRCGHTLDWLVLNKTGFSLRNITELAVVRRSALWKIVSEAVTKAVERQTYLG